MKLRKYLLLICFTTALPAMARDVAAPDPQMGSISCTVLDVNGDLVPGALVTLQCQSPCENRKETANDNAAFDFCEVSGIVRPEGEKAAPAENRL